MNLATQISNSALSITGTAYLLIAALCLFLALHQVKQLVIPIGPLIRAVAAVCTVILCLSAALVLLTAAAVGAH
ncbi:hypothetical protein [Paractinoplanes hotanensis]|uniref:Uncharacterized protein n=1 Tax=Paractinoplanes hotanensis TaxID=2906497 RepID=A0ABT0Y0Z6_9ACTN|nr:hypothetical protein [Actinoplanes hotanensis]MCM4079009.1 hypothetical protein [Actinoplanes hotanensis]